MHFVGSVCHRRLGASLPPPPFQQKVRLAFLPSDLDLDRHVFRFVSVLPVHHDDEFRPPDPIPYLLLPVAVQVSPYGRINDFKRRVRAFGQTDQCVAEVIVVIEVEADERAFPLRSWGLRIVEKVEYLHLGGYKVLDVAGGYDESAFKGGGRDERGGVSITQFSVQPAPSLGSCLIKREYTAAEGCPHGLQSILQLRGELQLRSGRRGAETILVSSRYIRSQFPWTGSP